MRAGVWVRFVAGVLGLILLTPTLIVAGTSFTGGEVVVFPPNGWSLRWYEALWASQTWRSAASHSLAVGGLAALVAMIVGTLLALGAVRGRGVSPRLISALALAPMVIPAVVAALGFYLVYVVLLGLPGGIFSLALAHSVLGIPFCFINVLAALTRIDKHVEEAARVCGADLTRTFTRIVLPIILPSVAIGGLLAFVTSWDEVVVAIFLNPPGFKTLPTAIFEQATTNLEPSTSAVATLVTVTSVLLLVASAAIARLRRTGVRLARIAAPERTGRL